MIEIVDTLTMSINAAIKKMSSLKALEEAALKIKADCIPITPMETGNLRQSMYIEPYPAKELVELGFTASYAPYVHEIKKQNYTTTGTDYKFLERAILKNKNFILEILTKRNKI